MALARDAGSAGVADSAGRARCPNGAVAGVLPMAVKLYLDDRYQRTFLRLLKAFRDTQVKGIEVDRILFNNPNVPGPDDAPKHDDHMDFKFRLTEDNQAD